MPSRRSEQFPQSGLLDKEPTTMHVGLSDYIKAQTGYDVDPVSVSLAVRLGVEYRASGANKARRAETRQSREERLAATAERKRQRVAERARKLQEQAAALLAEAGVVPNDAEPEVAPRKPRQSRAARNADKVVEERKTAQADAIAKREAAKAALRVVPDPEPEPDPDPDPSADADVHEDEAADPGEGVVDDGGADVFVLPTQPTDDGPIITFEGDEDDPDDDDDF